MTTPSWIVVFKMHQQELSNLVTQFANDLTRDFAKAVMEDDSDLLELILQKTFDNAPDSGYVHYLPGWGVLCNLCSKEG